MKTTRMESTEEKRVLTGMIVDPVVLGRVAVRWREGGLFRDRWSNLIGAWCVKYLERYDKAPGAAIQGMFESWAAKGGRDAAVVELVEHFLISLSDEYEDLTTDTNSNYTIDLAGEHFNAVALERVAEQIQGHIDRGETDEAMATATGWDKVELGVGAGVDVLNDRTAVQEAFESHTKPLVQYPGDLGRFFSDTFGRDEFVAFMGATGRGKTWWLMDLAWRAVRVARRKVAFFEVGDMSQNQIMRRFMCRAAKHPLKSGLIKYPHKITIDGECPTAEVVRREMEFEHPLDWRTAWAACQSKIRRRKVPLLKLAVYPNSSINVAGIRAVLQIWERSGWVPDFVIVDYADILMPPAGTADSRDQINGTWKQLRAMSQSLHCCVVTATQTDAASYGASTVGRSNFSEDRRKLDHVTTMIGINATEEETLVGVTRLNLVKRREAEYTESKCVHVAGCLKLGNPAMKSVLPKT